MVRMGLGFDECLNLRLPRRRLCTLLALALVSMGFIGFLFHVRNNSRTSTSLTAEWIAMVERHPERFYENLKNLPDRLDGLGGLTGRELWLQSRQNDTLRRGPPRPRLQPQERLGRRPRILCWLMTDPSQVNRTIAARDTWMKRCDIHLITSSSGDPNFPTIGLEGVPTGRDSIAQKSRASWKYVYEHHINDADFFIKADPDSYIMVDNLRYFLSQCNFSKPHIYGHALYIRPDGQQIHYVAGQAVVLTRESVKRLVTEALVKYPHCFKDGQYEDLKTGTCLTLVGGHVVDTRDNLGRETFLPPIKSSNMRSEGTMKDSYESAWYLSYRNPYGVCGDMTDRCVSERPVAFHRITEDMMFMMDFLERLLVTSRPPDIYASENSTALSVDQSSSQYLRAPSGEFLVPPRLSFNGTEFIGSANETPKESSTG